MKIVIIGPGAMGCLFAGILKEGRYDVWLLDKNHARAEFIANNGVRIDTEQGSRVVKVNITADPAEIGSAKLLFLCIKSYDTRAAIRHSLPLNGPETIVVSFQNGAGNAEQIAEVINKAQILCGITAYGSTSLGDGHVRHTGSGPTSVAPLLPGQMEKANKVAGLLTKSGLRTFVADNMQSMIWSKLVVNAAINPLTALYNVRNGQLLEDTELRETMRKAAAEAASVARARDISLTYDNEIKEVENICRVTASNFSSMLQDIRRGRRTEIDSITGVIVKEAHSIGLDVPTNKMLLERVHAIQRKGK